MAQSLQSCFKRPSRVEACRASRRIRSGTEKIMAIRIEKAFSCRFIDAGAKVLLELTNETERTLRTIEILTVFLTDQETRGGGPSQAHIRFDALKSIQAKEKAVLSHRTWINGQPADSDRDQMERLKVVAGESSPYVLHISWEEAEGKTQFQRIPVGH
jgi:hypothetical protein